MHQLQTKSKYRRGFKKWTDDKATEIRKELGLQSHSPICAFKLCEFLKIPIYIPSDIPGLADYYVDELIGNNASCWSAVTIPIGENNHIIIHNPIHTPARQQSNIMHELGHIICGHTISQNGNNVAFAGCLRNIDGEQEKEAEWLGACLQLPRLALIYCLKRNMTINDIAKHYNCSTEMAQYRMNISGVKNQVRHTKKQKIFVIH